LILAECKPKGQWGTKAIAETRGILDDKALALANLFTK
jgi:hypothetical protein